MPENTLEVEPIQSPETPDVEITEADPEIAPAEHVELEKLLGEYSGKGFTIAITRLQPRWCQGYLDEWPLEGGFSISDVRDQFGGRRFSLKVKRGDGTYVKSFSAWIDDEPRRAGRPLRLSPNAELADDKHPIIMGGGNADALKLIQQMHNQQMNFMMQMMTMKQEANPTNPAQQLAQTIELMRGLRDVASEFSPQDSGFGVGGTEIAKMFFEMMQQRKSAPQQQPAQPRPAPTGPPRPLAPAQAQRPAQARPHALPFVHKGPPAPPMEQSAAPQAEIEDVNENDEPLTQEELSAELADDLATLDAEHAANAFKQFLDRVPPEHARKVIEQIVGVPIDVDTVSAMMQNPANGETVGSDHGA